MLEFRKIKKTILSISEKTMFNKHCYSLVYQTENIRRSDE